MHISHIAIWSANPERLRNFYCKYFNAKAGEKYENSSKQFHSYFLSFDHGCQLEIMYKSDMIIREYDPINIAGYTHLAIAVGSKTEVDRLAKQLEADNYSIVGQPRTTGDGFYESLVADPDGNLIEITE
jgi:lactoylglutathione lyase